MSKNKEIFKNEISNASTPVVVDFWAEWCGPCKMIAPILDEIGAQLHEKVKIIKVNIDECPDLATEYGIRSIPTFLMFKNGSVVDTMTGAVPKSRLLEWINNSL